MRSLPYHDVKINSTGLRQDYDRLSRALSRTSVETELVQRGVLFSNVLKVNNRSEIKIKGYEKADYCN